MALPNEPLTRGEQYLNRIATGEGTIPDVPLTRVEQYLDYIAENGGGSDPSAVKTISLSDLPNVGNGTYTLGVVDVTEPVQFPRIQNRGIIIVDTVFNIKTPVLFTPYTGNFFTMPSFIGCTFNNGTSGRVLVVSNSNNIVGGRVTGCNFYNVDFAESSTYLQDFSFVNCYIQSYQMFLTNTASTVQARFVNCDVETESKPLVNAKNAYIYASGTYEGNASRNEYYFNAETGTFNFTNCWLESTKLLNLVGGTTVQQKSVIRMVGCNINITATPTVDITNAEYVNLFIDGSLIVPYNSSAKFMNKTAADLMSVTGDFVRASSDGGYVKPLGGVDAEDHKIATIVDIPVAGFVVPQSSVIPTLTFKALRHFGGVYISYNMMAYIYGKSDGATYGVEANHWGSGTAPTLSYDSTTQKYTITGVKYQGFTFIPNIDPRKFMSGIEMVYA